MKKCETVFLLFLYRFDQRRCFCC